MSFIISTLILVGIFVALALAGRRSTRRSDEFFKVNSVQVADLKEHAVMRYRQRFGKDPTTEMPALTENKRLSISGSPRK